MMHRASVCYCLKPLAVGSLDLAWNSDVRCQSRDPPGWGRGHLLFDRRCRARKFNLKPARDNRHGRQDAASECRANKVSWRKILSPALIVHRSIGLQLGG